METIEQVEVMSDHENSRTNIEDLVGYGQYFILNVDSEVPSVEIMSLEFRLVPFNSERLTQFSSFKFL